MVDDCGYSSVVERHLAKVNVARSNRVTRFQVKVLERETLRLFLLLACSYTSFLSHPKGNDMKYSLLAHCGKLIIFQIASPCLPFFASSRLS